MCARERAGVFVHAGVGVDARARASACALLVLLIQHATCMPQIFGGPSGSTKFFDIIS